mgnify:CR=1 FL=1
MLLTDKEYQRMSEEYNKVKYRCPRCKDHFVIIPAWVDRNLCDNCGMYVYKDKKTEFKYKMKEKLLRGK